jgi:TolB-like protein
MIEQHGNYSEYMYYFISWMLMYIIFLVPREHPVIVASFEELDDEEKWTLSTGTVVEDVLYNFSKQCVVDHPSCSIILDLDDLTYVNKKLFTKEELEEMKKDK